MRISTKINLIFISIFIISLSFFGIIITIFTFNTFKNEISKNILYNSQSVSKHINTFLKDQKETTEILAETSIYRDFLQETKANSQYKNIKNKVDNRIDRTLKISNNIFEVFILDKNGKVVASTDKKQEGKDKSSESYFNQNQKETLFKNIYFSDTSKNYIYTFSVPINQEEAGEFLGVLAISYNTNYLNYILNNFDNSYNSEETFLINRYFYFITPSRFLGDAVILNKTENTKSAQQCFLKEETFSNLNENKNYRQVDVLTNYSYIPETDWCLITNIDKSEFNANADLIKNIFILVLISVSSILFFVGVWVSQKITKPIEDLRLGAEIVGNGNLDYKVGTNSKDEIGQLSREFDLMTENLKQSRENIEAKVQQRTKELQRLNQAMIGRELKMIELKKQLKNKNHVKK